MFKNFLIKNKIYFEVASYFFSGIMSIIISGVGIWLTKKEVELNEIQYNPKFRITEEFYDENKKEEHNLIPDGMKLSIYNEGYQISEVNSKIRSFLDVSISGQALTKSDNFYIPLQGIYGYGYSIPSINDNLTGEIVYYEGEDSRDKYYKLKDDLYEYDDKDTLKYYSIKLFTLIKLEYKHIKDGKKEVYYKYSYGGGNTSEISKEYFMRMDSIEKYKLACYLDFDKKLDLQEILNFKHDSIAIKNCKCEVCL